MNAQNTQTHTLADDAFEQIRQRILDNFWPPGYRALEQEVAQALGMSRTPVREALVRLQTEGLIELIPRHGMHVLPVSAIQMCEIYEVLTVLECLAVEKVAQRRPTPQEIQGLIRATDEMEQALVNDDLHAWAKADENFHTELIELSGNKTLQAAMLGLADRAHRGRMFSLQLRPKPISSTKEHRLLVKKILAGDVEGAVTENRKHRVRASQELISIFDRYKFQHM
ncbi:GntR family transcriptional regulator [Zwartia sp.]|uniref:GntR family transcriptional regulator n=1 Tax=Zwartia sp. TaxID=2978004 RepID=UPI002716CABE|nr:GntR family transcriptional regulator [Zwartia sp.]MDO9024560.1 GntR family transcriptional regulator [Zwartia sp.]